MFIWDFGICAWSRFWRWTLIEICVRTHDQEVTLVSWSQPSGSLHNYAFGNVCTSKPGCIVLLSIFEVDIGQSSDWDLKYWLHRSKINGQRFFVLGASWGLPVAVVIVLQGIADLEPEKSFRNVKTLTRKISKKCQTFSRKSKNLDQKNSNYTIKSKPYQTNIQDVDAENLKKGQFTNNIYKLLIIEFCLHYNAMIATLFEKDLFARSKVDFRSQSSNKYKVGSYLPASQPDNQEIFILKKEENDLNI